MSEFDPLGFSLKDFLTGGQVMRYNSNGDHYPITKSSLSSQISLDVISSQLWHHRLGHPGDLVSSFLRKDNLISCINETSSNLCFSCEIAKHKLLPFHCLILLHFQLLILFLVICELPLC